MSFYINNKDAIPCKRCGSPTQMHGTKLCDPCWEKDRRGVFDLQDEVDHLRAERDKAEAALRASRPALTKDGERIIRQFLACYEKGYWLGMDPNTITRQALAEVCEAVLARMEIDRLRAERDKAEAALREVAEWCSHDGLFRARWTVRVGGCPTSTWSVSKNASGEDRVLPRSSVERCTWCSTGRTVGGVAAAVLLSKRRSPMTDPTRKIADLRALFEGDALAAWDVEDVFNDKLVQAIPALLDVAEAADKVSLLAAEYSATWSMLDDLKNANELLRKALARLADGQEKP